MEYLFNKYLKEIPESFNISCYYIIDNSLRYISLKEDNLYFLHYVDNIEIGEVILSSDNEMTFDSFVLSKNLPILSQKSSYENIDDTTSRVVSIETAKGNYNFIKRKPATEKNIIVRNSNGQKKLF